MPDEDNNFGGSFVLDFRKRWRHVQAENSFDSYLYRKPVKKKDQKKTNKTSSKKILNQRQRSMRWKDIRLVAADDR